MVLFRRSTNDNVFEANTIKKFIRMSNHILFYINKFNKFLNRFIFKSFPDILKKSTQVREIANTF